MPLFILSIVIQVAFIVHVIKTGRNTIWIWVLILLPLAGMLAYIIVELLPEMMGGRTGRRVSRKLQSVVNPNRHINEATRNYAVADTVENTIRLAEECLSKGLYQDAKPLFEKALSGIHEDDPDFMFGLARAEFGLNNFTATKSILDDLIVKNPNYKNVHAHLLYARAVEELGDQAAALKEYEVLDGYYPGPEASYRYAQLLRQKGDAEKARGVLEKIVNLSNTSGKHYNTIHKQWISKAKSELRT